MIQGRELESETPGISVQPAEADDAIRISEIFRQLNINDKGEAGRWDGMDWILEEIKNNNFIVAKNRNSIVGAACLLPNSEELNVYALAVDPFSQKLGIGKTLIRHAENIAKAKGISRLTVESYIFLNVRDYYLHLGFDFDCPPVKTDEVGTYFRFTKEI